MKIKSVIVDDDPYTRETLKDIIREHSLEVEIIAEFEQPLEAIEFLKTCKPELIFLDVHMPVLNGFEMLDHLDTSASEIIFITSFNQYAIQAIRYSALDYLLKPIKVSDLSNAIERFKKKTENVLTASRLNNLRHNLGVENEKQFQLVIPTKQGEYYFKVEEIVRCEADSNYTQICLISGKKFTASKTLGDIEEMLAGENFIRIHKSHLVNLNHVHEITNSDAVVMVDQTSITISRRRLQDVKSLWRRTIR